MAKRMAKVDAFMIMGFTRELGRAMSDGAQALCGTTMASFIWESGRMTCTKAVEFSREVITWKTFECARSLHPEITFHSKRKPLWRSILERHEARRGNVLSHHDGAGSKGHLAGWCLQDVHDARRRDSSPSWSAYTVSHSWGKMKINSLSAWDYQENFSAAETSESHIGRCSRVPRCFGFHPSPNSNPNPRAATQINC